MATYCGRLAPCRQLATVGYDFGDGATRLTLEAWNGKVEARDNMQFTFEQVGKDATERGSKAEAA